MFVFHVQQFSYNKCLQSGKDFMVTLYLIDKYYNILNLISIKKCA